MIEKEEPLADILAENQERIVNFLKEIGEFDIHSLMHVAETILLTTISACFVHSSDYEDVLKHSYNNMVNKIKCSTQKTDTVFH